MDIFPSKKSDKILICETLTILKYRHIKRIISAKTLPGNGIGNSDDITSPIQHMKKTITAWFKNFKAFTPKVKQFVHNKNYCNT